MDLFATKEISYIFALTNSGCSVARLSRLLWEQEAAGSNPATPTLTPSKGSQNPLNRMI